MILPAINTQQIQLLLRFKVYFKEPVDVRIVGVDAQHQKTTFFDRIANPGKSGVFELDFPMPISPEKLLMGFHNITNNDESAYVIQSVSAYHLPRAAVAFTQDEINFMNFIQWFCANASYLPYDSYHAKTGKYSIKYTEDIIDDEEGKLETPARMDHSNGEMQIAGSKFKLYTVPNRIVIGVHEGTHFMFDTKDESFCDLNSLRLCLGMGFPATECLYAFTAIFHDDPVGKQRIANIENYINKYKYQSYGRL